MDPGWCPQPSQLLLFFAFYFFFSHESFWSMTRNMTTPRKLLSTDQVKNIHKPSHFNIFISIIYLILQMYIFNLTYGAIYFSNSKMDKKVIISLFGNMAYYSGCPFNDNFSCNRYWLAIKSWGQTAYDLTSPESNPLKCCLTNFLICSLVLINPTASLPQAGQMQEQLLVATLELKVRQLVVMPQVRWLDCQPGHQYPSSHYRDHASPGHQWRYQTEWRPGPELHHLAQKQLAQIQIVVGTVSLRQPSVGGPGACFEPRPVMFSGPDTTPTPIRELSLAACRGTSFHSRRIRSNSSRKPEETRWERTQLCQWPDLAWPGWWQVQWSIMTQYRAGQKLQAGCYRNLRVKLMKLMDFSGSSSEVIVMRYYHRMERYDMRPIIYPDSKCSDLIPTCMQPILMVR